MIKYRVIYSYPSTYGAVIGEVDYRRYPIIREEEIEVENEECLYQKLRDMQEDKKCEIVKIQKID